ncbi:kelch-like protein 3 [Montipora capricornis]|uniref:kelch-like protein 3 n=1 Tax=Montipora capricornis TaxID=246305 RepID=UPI0035F1AE49
MSQSPPSIDKEEYVEAVALEIKDLNTSASNSNMADLSQPMPSDPSKYCQELIYRLDALRRKESFYDVTVSVKDKEFKAHRLVLAAASPFFLSLLVSDMREGKEQFIRIELEEATGSVMEEVLKYIYTGNVAVTKENAHDLVAAADYLLLPGMKNLACDVLETNITLQNCIFNYDFAGKYQCLELMHESCEFINSNFSSVMETEDFLKLDIEQVMKWVSSDYVTVGSEEEIFKGIVQWVSHKKSERESNFAELLRQVRLKFMSRDFLLNELVNEELVATSNASLNFVLRSMDCIFDPFCEDAAKPPRKCFKERYADVIFVCGGRTALCYAPQDDIWYLLPDMLFEHQDHAVVQYRDKVCIFGGQRVGPGESHVIEYFLFSTNCWGTVERRHENDNFTCLSVLAGYIYALDSFDGAVFLYKLDDNVCEAVADPPTVRYGACLVSDKRHLYLVGGSSLPLLQTSQTVERFDPMLATWEEVAAMNEARYDAFGAAMNGKIYIAGGMKKIERHHTVLKSCEVYDPSTNEWQVISSLKVCRQSANMACIQEALYVVGGFKDTHSSSRELSVEVFQLGACEWKNKSTIPTNFENANHGDRKKKIHHHKACLAVIHKSLLEKLCKL